MKNMTLLSACLVMFSIQVSFCQTTSDQELTNRALKIHDQVLTIDTHNDTPMRFSNRDFDMSVSHDFEQDGSRVDFARMKTGGLDGAFFAVFLGQGPLTDQGRQQAYERARQITKAVVETAERNKEIASIATNPDQAYSIEREGKRIVFIGMENGYPLGTDLNRIEEFYNMGVRYITLCHSSNNDICDSSTDRVGPIHSGLSDFGHNVVAKMNQLGMMIDVSHISDESFFDVIKTTKAPVIASHSSARAICNSPRNLSDEMLVALAKNGGVIQICILSSYIKEPEANPEREQAMNLLREKYGDYETLSDEERREMRAAMNEIRRKYPTPIASVKDAVDHIDHVVKLIGVEHVGIGTDFDGGGGLTDCQDVSEMGNISIELVKRGYSSSDIEKIWGGNIMRVMSEVEKIGKELSAE